MSIVKKSFEGIKWTAYMSAYKIALQFSQLTILAYILPIKEFGFTAIITIFLGLSDIISDFGMGRALIQKEKITSIEFSSVYWFNLLITSIAGLLLVISDDALASFFNYKDFTFSSKLILFVFIINGLGNPFYSLMQKELLHKLINKINIVAITVTFVVTIVTAYFSKSANSLLIGSAAGFFVNSVAYIKFSTKGLLQFKMRLKSIKGLISFGLYQTGERIINQSKYYIDKLMISTFIGLEALAIYNVAWTILILPVSKINPIILKTSFPLFAKLKNDYPRLNEQYISLVNLAALVNFPLIIGLAAVSSEFVSVFFANEFIDAASIIKIYIFVFLVAVIGNPGGSLLLAKGYAKLNFWWNIFNTVVTTCLIYLFLQFNSALEYVVYAHLCTTVLIRWYWHYLVIKKGGINYKPILTFLLKIISVSVLMVICLLTYDYFSIGIYNDVVNLIFKILIGGSIYIIGMYITSKKDIIFITDKIRGLN